MKAEAFLGESESLAATDFLDDSLEDKPPQSADDLLSFEPTVTESVSASLPQSPDLPTRTRQLIDQESSYQQSMADYNTAYGEWEQGFMDARAFDPTALPGKQPALPTEPRRPLDQLTGDLQQGISYIRPQELALLINGIETGKVDAQQIPAIRQLLADQLGPEGQRAFDMADKTRDLYLLRMAEQESMEASDRKWDTFGRAVANSASLGIAYSPDEEKLNSTNLDEAAQERATQLMRETEGGQYWGSRLSGDMAGFMAPYLGAVKMLRTLRKAKGLAPVGEGLNGALLEGALAGGAVDLATRPRGAENMTAGENISARIAQAGVGAVIGAAADVGMFKLSDWLKVRMTALKNKKLKATLEKEAKGAGYESTDDYLDSLVELVQTDDGAFVRPRKEIVDDLPELDGATVRETGADIHSATGRTETQGAEAETFLSEKPPPVEPINTAGNVPPVNSAGSPRNSARVAEPGASEARVSQQIEKAEVFSKAGLKDEGLTELGRTARHVETATLPTGIKQVQQASDVAHVTAPYRKSAQETFLTVVTDKDGRVLRVARLHTGGKADAPVEPATVAGVATNTPGASKAWFVHNHPSGDVTQSALDKELTARLDDLLDGSGIEPQGMVTIGPDAKFSYHQPTDRQGFTANERAYDELDMDGEVAQNIPPKGRRDTVPVTERRLSGKGSDSPSVADSDSLEQYFKANPDQKEGVLLLDSMRKPVGWLPLTKTEMAGMRTGKGGGSDKLLRAIDRTNATAIAGRVNSIRTPDLNQVAGNLDGFSRQAGVQLMDVADNTGSALGKRQDLPSQSTFYSNPFGMASREIAQQLGLEQGIAAAGGGAYGGISSDNEMGSAKWWLDVSAGAGAAALASAGLKYTGVTGKDGFLSRHVSRLGNAIDELPLIGRGNTNVRELKERQRLMKQVLDRQTEEMGAELLKRFTPAERGMMADLIENKGIIKDYNLIHRQAAELDEFISYTSGKLRDLGMLPPDLETGGYLHRYYSKHLNSEDTLIKAAKKLSMSGSYSITRGTDDMFEPEYLSSETRQLVGRLDQLNKLINQSNANQRDLLDVQTQIRLAELRQERKELQKKHLREYLAYENGQVKSFIFTENEAPNIPGKSPDEMQMTEREWSAKGLVKGKAMLHRDWTQAERNSWGEIKDAGYRFVRGQAEVAHDLSLATFFKKVADNDQWVSDIDPGGWHFVSNQKVGRNSPLQKYGALAGKYVDPKIWSAVRHHGRAPFGNGIIANTYRGLLNRWKLYKTVYNPVTHFNNTWSNTEMYLMAGYETKQLASAIKALKQGENNQLWRDARDSGLFGQDWSRSITQGNEGGGNSVLDDLAEQLRTQPDIPDAMQVTDSLMRFKEWWINSKQSVKDADTKLKTGMAVAKAVTAPASMLVRKPIKAAAQSAQKLYQLEDELFKLAAFAQERSAGATKREAVNAANRFFFNYNDLPEAVKVVRDFPIGSPFISYTYLAIPAIVRNVVERPERILALAAMYESVNFAGMTINDDMEAGEYWQRLSDEDELSPKWNKGRAIWGARNAVTLPFLDGYRMTFGNAHALGNPFAGEAGDRQFALPGPMANFWGSDVFGSNPLRAILDVVGNEDWKGKEIVSPEASTEEKAKAYAAYLYQAWAPSNPITPGSYHQEKIFEGLANDVNQARAKGEKANGLAEGMVSMANEVSRQLGFEQFTGLDGSGNEILTRDSALGSVGIKLRPMRPDQFMQFEIQDISRKQQKLDSDLKKSAKRFGHGKATEQQLEDKQSFHLKQTGKYTKEITDLVEAWNRLHSTEK